MRHARFFVFTLAGLALPLLDGNAGIQLVDIKSVDPTIVLPCTFTPWVRGGLSLGKTLSQNDIEPPPVILLFTIRRSL